MAPYGWWPGFGFMWIFPLLFLIVVIVFLSRGGPGRFWRGGWHDNRRDEKRESPREILDRRYASGEISKEQYEEMRRTLER
ncbi:MAG TPA: SHOCT domain-containing protein [Steroidobacteraceae bacterium]|nr:SHOCT domain-containing protein [Steroidobacteraceae bacterium]